MTLITLLMLKSAFRLDYKKYREQKKFIVCNYPAVIIGLQSNNKISKKDYNSIMK